MNKKPILLTLASASIVFIAGCDVEQTKEARLPDVDVEGDAGNMPEYEVVQTEEGELPSVDVDAEGGQMPEFDVELADVDVGTTTETVEVPKVKLVVEEEEVEVPYIDVDMPNESPDNQKVRQQIMASVKTPNPGYELTIQKVYMIDDEITVISKLTEGNVQRAEGQGVAHDAIVINAPEADINHYVISTVEGLEGNNEDDYEFVRNAKSLEKEMDEGSIIYTSGK